MLMPCKVKISIELLNKIIEFLESLENFEDMPPETQQLYGYVYYALKHKKNLPFGMKCFYTASITTRNSCDLAKT